MFGNLAHFLPLKAIAEGTGIAVALLRKLAKASTWRQVTIKTGRRGRPPLAFHVQDVLNTLAESGLGYAA